MSIQSSVSVVETVSSVSPVSGQEPQRRQDTSLLTFLALAVDDPLNAAIEELRPDLFAIFIGTYSQRFLASNEDVANEIAHLGDEQFQAMQHIRAEQLQKQLTDYAAFYRTNFLMIGWMMVHGERLGLHTYLGYDTMKSWASASGVEPSVRKHAILLMEVWPYMRWLGYTLGDLTTEKYTVPILKAIVQQSRTALREIKQMQAASPSVHVQEDLAGHGNTVVLALDPPQSQNESESESEEFDDPLLLSSIDNEGIEGDVPASSIVPPHQSEDVMASYAAQARAQIEYMTSLAPEDLIQEMQSKQGTSSGPTITIYGLRRTASGHFRAQEVVITGDEEAFKALARSNRNVRVTMTLHKRAGMFSPQEFAEEALKMILSEDLITGEEGEQK